MKKTTKIIIGVIVLVVIIIIFFFMPKQFTRPIQPVPSHIDGRFGIVDYEPKMAELPFFAMNYQVL